MTLSLLNTGASANRDGRVVFCYSFLMTFKPIKIILGAYLVRDSKTFDVDRVGTHFTHKQQGSTV